MGKGLVFSIVVSILFCTPVLAYDWSTNPGDGSLGNPYQISTPEQLISIDSDMNLLDKHFVLVNDIDLSIYSFNKAILAPKVNKYSIPFTGSLDGAYYTISNIKVNGADYLGLFGYIGLDGFVSDLVLENVYITGIHYIGGLCGRNEGNLNDCVMSGTIDGGYSGLGGLCGMNYGNITNCRVDCTVKGGFARIGGLCGGSYQGTISNCYTTGIVGWVTSQGQAVGGLVGQTGGCTILNSYSTSMVSGLYYIGGLCGENDPDSNITGCYATGAVIGNKLIGGLCGLNDEATITNCYAMGSVNGDERIGGFCGYNHKSNLTNCYAIGTVSGNIKVGGFLGDNYNGHVSFNYYLFNAGPNNGYGQPLTDTQMKQQASFVGWDFEDAWWIDEGNDYPRLWWEFTNTLPIADAGDDQVVYAWIDGHAMVQLDGTESYDPDGDALEYYWYDDANELIATGAEPNVMLPVGVHVIDLIVNDGIEDSEPDSCVVTVIQVLEVPMRLTPQSLNCRSKGNWVKAHFALPEAYSISDVDSDRGVVVDLYGIESALLEVAFNNKEKCVEITAFFDREVVCSLAKDWPEVFRIYGFFADGSVYFGESGIRIHPAGLKEVSEFASSWLLGDCGDPGWCGGLDLNRDTQVNMQDYPLLLNSEVEFTTE